MKYMYILCLFLELSYEYTKKLVIYISGKVDPSKILKLITKQRNAVEL